MTAKTLVRTTLLASALALSAPVFAAPSTHDVYVAAEAGKFAEAQAMMDQVLKEHPNSGKAHFVEAELLAKQGKFAAAEAELKTAERLEPGLPFAKADAVAKLRTLLASGQAAAAPRSNYGQSAPAAAPAKVQYRNAEPSTPWGTILILGALAVGFIIVVSRFMSRRTQQVTPTYSGGGLGGTQSWGNGGGAPQQGYPQQGYPQPGYGPGYGQAPQPGMGSRIMGGLATGAAVGAGIVAGEALMHRFTDGERGGSHDANAAPRNDIVYDQPNGGNDLLRSDDMGGSDFGLNDSSSWDSGGGGGGDSGGGSDDW